MLGDPRSVQTSAISWRAHKKTSLDPPSRERLMPTICKCTSGDPCGTLVECRSRMAHRHINAISGDHFHRQTLLPGNRTFNPNDSLRVLNWCNSWGNSSPVATFKSFQVLLSCLCIPGIPSSGGGATFRSLVTWPQTKQMGCSSLDWLKRRLSLVHLSLRLQGEQALAL